MGPLATIQPPAVEDPILPVRRVGAGDLALAFLIMSVVFYRASATMADPDLWGHVRFGLDTCLAGHIIEEDPYSYLTGGQRWINHEWLAEVIMALAFQAAGGTGLIMFKVVVVLLMLGWIYRDLWRQGLDALRGGMVLLLVTLPFLVGVGAVRPQLFTFLGFLVTLVILRRAERGQGGWLWALPPVLVLWVNSHGGFLAGLVVLLVWWCTNLVVQIVRQGLAEVLLSRAAWASALAVATTFLATLANPYGFDLPLFLLRTATVPRPEITEWGPLNLVSGEGVYYLLLLALVVMGLSFSRRRLQLPLLMVLLGLALAPLVAVRHLPLFALAVPILAGAHIASAWEHWFPEKPFTFQIWRVILPPAAAVLVTLAALPNVHCLRLDPQAGFDFPTRVVSWLRECQASGNMVVHFDWGEYVIWHLGPNVKVSLDGRRETVFADAVYAANVNFRNGLQDWDTLLKRRRTDFVLVSKKWPVFNLMKLKQSDWLLIYEDHLCALFLPKESPWVEILQSTAVPRVPIDGTGLCFPDHGSRLMPD